MALIRNPVIPGFFPDPSIVRVDDDFYIVNSSFEYFPAIPIWHSRDLIHWRQIGNVVTRADQNLDLADVAPSGGVQAATIRHHNGTFYVTSTRVKRMWPDSNYHFVVTATDINGPWSECHFIEDAYGIDSALFFDDDGTAYFLANREKVGSRDGADVEIWMSEIDLTTFQLVGEKRALWAGTGGIYPEGPRMFKRNGWYYLLIAEGGTLHNHTTTMARSRSVFGPFESSPRNPLLTHKHLNREHPIQNVGHADLVELADGTWWGVCLGSRPRGGFYDGGNTKYSFGGYYRNLGRETFVFPVSWPADDLSPLLSADTGRIEFEYEAPNLLSAPQSDVPLNFSPESLATKWVAIRRETRDHYHSMEPGALQLLLGPTTEDSFFGIRQTSWSFAASVDVDISSLHAGDVVGLAAYIKPDHYLSVEILRGESSTLTISSSTGTQKSVQTTTELQHLRLSLRARDQDYTFSVDELDFRLTLDGREISCDMTDSHTGVMIAFIGESSYGSSVKLSGFTVLTDQPMKD